MINIGRYGYLLRKAFISKYTTQNTILPVFLSLICIQILTCMNLKRYIYLMIYKILFKIINQSHVLVNM